MGGEESMAVFYHFGIIKRCPACPIEVIQKDGGCQHMTCPCGASHCWLCAAAYYPTTAHDASFHRRECLLWQPPGPSEGDRCKPRNAPNVKQRGDWCECCEEKGGGTFCDARPTSQCKRTKNEIDADNDDESKTHCACRHGCPCDATMELISMCQGGHAPSACTCGNSIVRCCSCQRESCRLCDRPPHSGEPCLEDHGSAEFKDLDPSKSEQMEVLRRQIPAAGPSSSGGAGPSGSTVAID